MKAREYLSKAMKEYLGGKSVAEADEAAISIIEEYGQECFRAGVEAMQNRLRNFVVANRKEQIGEDFVLMADVGVLAHQLLTEGEKE